MSLVVRTATPDDIPALVTLVVESYRANFATIIGDEGLAQRGSDYFTDRLSREVHYLSVTTTKSGLILGMAEVRAGVLDMLFVDPAATGSGCGVALLRDAERRGAVRLECFHANAGARRFYAREGWCETGDYRREFAGRMLHFVSMENR